MHFLMMVAGLGLAWAVRSLGMNTTTSAAKSLSQRWQQTLGLFLFSPLLLLMTAIAILCMGPTGRMVGHGESWFSYDLAVGFLAWALVSGIKLAWEGWQTVRRLRQNPTIEVSGMTARLLDTDALYSAQVGFWQPELVVSQGLLNTLDEEHLEAVLTHEQAHARHHDTFWFFGLGWLRRLTIWLPGTENLWQELLMLRELRADHDAAQQVDALVLAESLLMVVSTPMLQPEVCAAFGWAASPDRLTERINSLLAEPAPALESKDWSLGWLILVLLPLASIPFHVGF
ncbi:MAG: M56 family metallopeptidase [Leptolyngbyaceae cyanobacterium bins.302]|nr:M56 family metallopeptidase [Leptolyngbyaceae cyanobacterium bins.302]